jgi:hypothetical protein
MHARCGEQEQRLRTSERRRVILNDKRRVEEGQACIKRNTHTHSHSHSHILTHSHTHILTYTHTHMCVHTHTRSLSFFHTHSHSTHAYMHAHTHSLSHSHIHTFTRAYIHSHVRTNTRVYTWEVTTATATARGPLRTTPTRPHLEKESKEVVCIERMVAHAEGSLCAEELVQCGKPLKYMGEHRSGRNRRQHHC